MTSTPLTTVDVTGMTRAQRTAPPLSADVAQAVAEQHGVCVRPLAMRRIDTTEEHKELLAARADLVAAYADRRAVGDEVSREAA